MNHYTWAEILDLAHDIGDGYREAILALKEGETACSPLSNKWDFRGPGEIVYLIHPAEVCVTTSGQISKAYK